MEDAGGKSGRRPGRHLQVEALLRHQHGIEGYECGWCSRAGVPALRCAFMASVGPGVWALRGVCWADDGNKIFDSSRDRAGRQTRNPGQAQESVPAELFLRGGDDVGARSAWRGAAPEGGAGAASAAGPALRRPRRRDRRAPPAPFFRSIPTADSSHCGRRTCRPRRAKTGWGLRGAPGSARSLAVAMCRHFLPSPAPIGSASASPARVQQRRAAKSGQRIGVCLGRFSGGRGGRGPGYCGPAALGSASPDSRASCLESAGF